MTQEKFMQAATRFKELKSRLDAGEITVPEMKEALKKLMIVDEEGRYWMIGGKSGLWYRHDGSRWIQDDPPREPETHDTGDAEPEMPVITLPQSSQEERPRDEQESTSPFSGEYLQSSQDSSDIRFDPDPGDSPDPSAPLVKTETEAVHQDARARVSTQPMAASDSADCRVCDAVIPADAEYCPACGANQNETGPPRTSPTPREMAGRTLTLHIRSIYPFSLLFLLGGLGLILGVILGASFGIFSIFGDLIYQFPRMLQETRGKIQGGLIFGVLGGIAGFISFAMAALVASGLFNILAELFGGLRIRVRF